MLPLIFCSRGQIRLHAIEERLGWRWQTWARRQLLLSWVNTWKMPKRGLAANLLPVRLLFFGQDYAGTKQAVADPIALSVPCHTIVDNIGVDGSAPTNLAGLDPIVLAQNGDCIPNPAFRPPGKLGKRLLRDDDSIMLADLTGQNVHHLGSER